MQNRKQASDKYLIAWLSTCAVLIFIMIILGGVTRLSNSGLSMVEWHPILGAIPPITESDWQHEFSKYKTSPEFEQINFWMSLDDFKSIYYFEYAHRLLGRLIGIVFFLPLLIFGQKGYIREPLRRPLFGIFVLGAFQGILGWYMVKSGLVNEPRVSSYRLMAHLGTAVVILASIVWIVSSLVSNGKESRTPAPIRIRRGSLVLAALIFVMHLSGSLVAALDAGLMWNTFPLMGDTLLPPGAYSHEVMWRSIFEDGTTAQFNHRLLALSILVLATWLLLTSEKSETTPSIRNPIRVLFSLIACQVMLGISTLLYLVPIWLGALHQAMAILVFCLSIFVAHRVTPSRSERRLR